MKDKSRRKPGTQSSPMDGIFRIKKLLALFLFLVPIHGARCKSDSTKKVQDDEPTELSWKIGDFYSFRGKYTPQLP